MQENLVLEVQLPKYWVLKYSVPKSTVPKYFLAFTTAVYLVINLLCSWSYLIVEIERKSDAPCVTTNLQAIQRNFVTIQGDLDLHGDLGE